VNLLQVIPANDEDEKGKGILDGGSEYYWSPIWSQETKAVLKPLPPSAFEPMKQNFMCLFWNSREEIHYGQIKETRRFERGDNL